MNLVDVCCPVVFVAQWEQKINKFKYLKNNIFNALKPEEKHADSKSAISFLIALMVKKPLVVIPRYKRRLLYI